MSHSRTKKLKNPRDSAKFLLLRKIQSGFTGSSSKFPSNSIIPCFCQTPQFHPSREILTALPLAGASLPFSVSSTTSFFSFKSLKGAKKKKETRMSHWDSSLPNIIGADSQAGRMTDNPPLPPFFLGGGRRNHKHNTT